MFHRDPYSRDRRFYPAAKQKSAGLLASLPSKNAVTLLTLSVFTSHFFFFCHINLTMNLSMIFGWIDEYRSI